MKSERSSPESTIENLPILQPKSPWGGGTIIGVSMVTCFLAGGILTGINWRRMGKSSLAWPTILSSVLVFVLYILLGPTLVVPPFDIIVVILINLIAASTLWFWQRSTYIEWKKAHPDVLKAGYQIPALTMVGIVFFALGTWLILSLLYGVWWPLFE